MVSSDRSQPAEVCTEHFQGKGCRLSKGDPARVPLRQVRVLHRCASNPHGRVTFAPSRETLFFLIMAVEPGGLRWDLPSVVVRNLLYLAVRATLSGLASVCRPIPGS